MKNYSDYKDLLGEFSKWVAASTNGVAMPKVQDGYDSDDIDELLNTEGTWERTHSILCDAEVVVSELLQEIKKAQRTLEQIAIDHEKELGIRPQTNDRADNNESGKQN